MNSALLTLLLALSPAEAGELREPVMALLNAHDHTPEAAEYEKPGSGVVAELLSIAQDAEVPSSRRGRAITTLGFFPNDEVKSWLVAQLDGSDHLVQRKAAYAIATGWPAEAHTHLAKALGADDVQLRNAAVRALGTVKSDDARKALAARKAVETEASVISAIDSVLEAK